MNSRTKLGQEGGINTRKHSENSGVDFQVLQAQPEHLARSQRHCLARNLRGQQEQVPWWILLISPHCSACPCTDAAQISLNQNINFFLLTELFSINQQDLSPGASTGMAMLEYLELVLFHYWMHSPCYTTIAISFLVTLSPSSPQNSTSDPG